MKKNIKLLILLLILMLGGLYIEPDDKELFMGSTPPTTVLRPNVVIMMDNSGSMNTIIYYPLKGLDNIAGTADDGFNPNESYADEVVDEFNDYSGINYLSYTGWHARWITSSKTARKFNTSDMGVFYTGCYAGSGTDFQVGSNSVNFYVGNTIVFRDTVSPYSDAVAQIASKYTDSFGNPWVKLINIKGGPITPGSGHFQKAPTGNDWTPVIIKLYGATDEQSGEYVRYPNNYARWLYLHATNTMRTTVSHFSTYGTFDVTQTPGAILSNCATPGNDDLSGSNPRLRKLFTRIQTAREVICKVAKDSNKFVKLGLFTFDSDNGAKLNQGLTDMSDEASGLVSYKNNVWNIGGTAWTPLAEALADIWFYYKPGPSSKTYWPVDYEIAFNTVNHSTTAANLIQWWCQNNYAVIMTDGESTKDNFGDAKYNGSIFKTKNVKRTEPWTNTDHKWDKGWGDPDNNDGTTGIPTNYNINSTYCPNYTCWIPGDSGTDYLDDVAYFIRHQDMFPDSFFGDDPSFGWPGDQTIYTYVIGFAADNNMLEQTAINGDGAYYTAGNYEELVTAFQTVITSINLRNFAFSSITAPKKSTTATNDELTVSYVGYFLPSGTNSIWEGHLLAHRLDDLWGFDTDGNGKVGPEEFVYNSELQCVTANNGAPCERWVYLNIGHEWDAAEKIPIARNIYTSLSSSLTTNLDFNLSNIGVLKHLLGLTTTDDLTKTEQATQIINKINEPKLADIFHSDVIFVGPPSAGKQFLPNIDPPGTGDEKYITHYTAHQNRPKVIYVGTNDGILHMFHAEGLEAGTEAWGFIPDEVMTSLSNIVINKQHTYTVDGRLTSGDVFFDQGGVNSWASILCFGLRQGGKAYYAMDISDVTSSPVPKVLWKFKDNTWSGDSWGQPIIGRVLLADPNDDGQIMQKWVVFLTGGFAFNNENANDKKGKAIFMVDAGTGELLWKLAYDPTITYSGTEPPEGILKTAISGTTTLLTKEDVFNFSIPSCLSAVDVDGNGFIDTLYFGNKGGHLFKTDVSKPAPLQWQTSILFKTEISTKATATISSITPTSTGKYDILLTGTASTAGFVVGDPVMGVTSKANGYITFMDQKTISVVVNAGTFQVENIVSRTYNPIYLSPAVMYDKCYTLWVAFGTGDRDRPRTNPRKGQFVLFKDNGTLLHKVDNDFTTGTNETSHLNDLTSLWTGTEKDSMAKNIITENGCFFDFPDNGEKIFDPEIVVLPDQLFNPRIYFNTYQPPVAWTKKNADSPCDLPPEGKMTFFQLNLGCGGTADDITGSNHTGRIAGGGVYGGKEYIMYEGTDGQVASVPGEEGGLNTQTTSLHYAGGVVFFKEKKR